MGGCGLALIHGNKDGHAANSETADDTSDHELVPARVGGGDLNDVADDEDGGPSADTEPTAHATVIGDRSGDEGANECTNRELAQCQRWIHIQEH